MEIVKQGGQRLLTIEGVTKSIYAWCKELNLNDATVRYRLRSNWTPEQAFGFAPAPLPYTKHEGRVIRDKERTQRGCVYCLDAYKAKSGRGNDVGRYCKHKACPYHELDNVKTYGEYIKKTDQKGFVKALEALGIAVE